MSAIAVRADDIVTGNERRATGSLTVVS